MDAGPSLALPDGRGLLAHGRRTAKALAEQLLPDSLVVFRGPEGRRGPLGPLRRALSPVRAATPGRIAITFDDGPTPLTLSYLDVLEQFGARATFFLVGELCKAHPELVAAIAERGHELAGHGYTHRRFTSFSHAELVSELDRTRALLPPRHAARQLVRPPFGAVSLSSLLACGRSGYTTVLWSLNSGDWRASDASEVERTVAATPSSAGEILLFHEGQALTLNALPAILQHLKDLGHELVTVGELLG
jgi:peptidoglycan-N-acetylglucosamine deacetylase